MKKSIFGAFVVSLGFFDICCGMQNVNPQRVTQAAVPSYLGPLRDFINSIPATYQGNLITRFNDLSKLGGAVRLRYFQAIFTDAKAQFQLAEKHDAIRWLFQSPALVVNRGFRKHNKDQKDNVVNFDIFNSHFLQELYDFSESEYLNEGIFGALISNCFGEYINIRGLDASISNLTSGYGNPGRICLNQTDEFALTSAIEDLEIYFENMLGQFFLLPKFVLLGDDANGFRKSVIAAGGDFHRVQSAVTSYNLFVDKLRSYVNNMSILDKDTDTFDINTLFDLGLLNEECAFDKKLLQFPELEKERKILFFKSDENGDVTPALYLRMVLYNDLPASDALSDLVAACHQRTYDILTYTNFDDYSTYIAPYKTRYLQETAFSITNMEILMNAKEQYQNVVDMKSITNCFIDTDKEFYSMKPLEVVIKTLSPNIGVMDENSFRSRFKKIFLRILHICLSQKQTDRIIPKQAGLFGSNFDTAVNEDLIRTCLVDYQSNPKLHDVYFRVSAEADTDYIENGADLTAHLNDSLGNINGDHFFQSGMYSVPHITKYIAIKLESMISAIERNPNYNDPKIECLLDSIAVYAGMCLQSFHHCTSGRMELILKSLLSVIEEEDFKKSGIEDILKVLSSVVASNIISDTLQFRSEYDVVTNGKKETKIKPNNESATFFISAAAKLEGRYGASTLDQYGFHGNNLLKLFLETERPRIWAALPNDIKTQMDSVEFTPNIIQNVVKVAMSVPNFISVLSGDNYGALADLLISKYLKEHTIQDIDFSNNELRKQILADILYEYGMFQLP